MKKKKSYLLTILPYLLIATILIFSNYNKIVLLSIISCFQLIDIYLTDKAIKMGCKETNPFGIFLQRKFKKFWFIPAIIIFILILIIVIYPMDKELITFMVGFYLMILINNYSVFKKKKKELIKKNKKNGRGRNNNDR